MTTTLAPALIRALRSAAGQAMAGMQEGAELEEIADEIGLAETVLHSVRRGAYLVEVTPAEAVTLLAAADSPKALAVVLRALRPRLLAVANRGRCGECDACQEALLDPGTAPACTQRRRRNG